MSDTVYHGDQTPVEQPGQRDWSADQGQSERKVFAGEPSGILAKFEEDKESGEFSSISMREEAGISTVEMIKESASTEDLPEGVLLEKWQLKRNNVRRLLRTHPFFDPVGQGPYLDEVDMAIRKKIAYDDIKWSGPGHNDTTKKYYYYRAGGVTAYNYSSYVIAHIQKFAAESYIEASEEETNKVVDLPADLPEEIETIVEADQDGNEIEWLLQPIDLSPQDNGQYTASQEYWGGTPLWALFYGGTWDPTP